MYFGLIGFGILVALIGIVVGLVIQILFLLNLMRLLEAVHPANRTMSPGLVWLNLIPVFSLGWMIYTVIKIRDSVGRENASRWGASVDERNTHTIGLVYSILAAAGFVFSFGGYNNRGVSVFGGLISLAVLILWILYWVRTNRLRRDLEMTAGRGYGPAGPYGPGSQYGAGGQYSPGAPGYGPGTPGYGAGAGGYGASGAGYDAGYGVAPTGQEHAPAPSWDPLGSTPPAATPAPVEETAERPGGSEGGRNCSQCGSELSPDDQFCRNCGAPAPKE